MYVFKKTILINSYIIKGEKDDWKHILILNFFLSSPTGTDITKFLFKRLFYREQRSMFSVGFNHYTARGQQPFIQRLS